jgi:hypothetical protein
MRVFGVWWWFPISHLGKGGCLDLMWLHLYCPNNSKLQTFSLQKMWFCWAQVAHACSPSYLGVLRSRRSWFKATLSKKLWRSHLNRELDKVAHNCHTKLLWGWNTEDCCSSLAQAKKFMRLHLKGKKLGVVVCACHSSEGGKLKTEV